MDPYARLDELAAPLRADVLSGASEVSSRAAEILRNAAHELPASSRAELRAMLGALAVRMLEAQPSMAPLLALVRSVLAAVEGSGEKPSGTPEPPEHEERASAAQEARSALRAARQAAAEAAAAFRDALETRTRAVAERASKLLSTGGIVPAEGLVGTLSSSATVRTALLLHAGGWAGRVLCFESRPMAEGRVLARALAEAGIAVTYAVDAAIHVLAPSCDVILLGADSIGDRGVVNKIGSLGLVHAARSAGVPVYVLADQTKILPRGVPQPLDDDRPADEVWPRAPSGVTAWNHYFEAVPLALVTGVVTESGTFGSDELEGVRSRLDLPGRLRTWAEGRAHRAPGA